jgi:hypothetical protein
MSTPLQYLDRAWGFGRSGSTWPFAELGDGGFGSGGEIRDSGFRTGGGF